MIPRGSLVAPHFRHAIADARARSAHVRAMRQLLVARYGPARFLARPAELGAGAARDDVIRRPAQHEVGARLADLRAVEQQADEVDLRQLAAAARDAVLQ